MSLIKHVKPVPQQRSRSGIDDAETSQRQKLTKAEIGIVASSGFIGLIVLILTAWLLLPLSSHIVPFVVAGAFPLFTLLAVIYQAVVYRRQWNAMLNALKQTDKVIEKMQSQLRVIERQAKAMEESVVETQKLVAHGETSIKVAERNMVYGQRAYIAIVEKSFTETGFSLMVENSGNTPALEVAVNAIVGIGLFPPELKDSIEGFKHIGLLAPHTRHPYVVKLGRQLSDDEKAEFASEFTGPLCCWWVTGYVFYRDIFQDRPNDYHVTEFCFFYGRKTEGGVEAHSSGNTVKEYQNGQDTKRNPN